MMSAAFGSLLEVAKLKLNVIVQTCFERSFFVLARWLHIEVLARVLLIANHYSHSNIFSSKCE